MRCWVSKSGFDEKINHANLENITVVGIFISMLRGMFDWQTIVLLGKSFLYLSITYLYLYVLLRLFKMLSVNDRAESLVCLVDIKCTSR